MTAGDGVHPILQTRVVRKFDRGINKYWYEVEYYAINDTALFMYGPPEDYKSGEPWWFSHSRTLDKEIALQSAKILLITADAPIDEVVATFTRESI